MKPNNLKTSATNQTGSKYLENEANLSENINEMEEGLDQKNLKAKNIDIKFKNDHKFFYSCNFKK